MRKTFYPVKDVTLKGILNNPNLVLPGLSDIFLVREYVSLQGAFLLSVHELLTNARKEFFVDGGITLDADIVETFSNKTTKDLSASIALSTIIETAIQQTLSIKGGFVVDSDLIASAAKELGQLESELMLDGYVSNSRLRTGFEELFAGISLSARLTNSGQQKSAVVADVIAMLGSLSATMSKSSQISGRIEIGSAIITVLRKYRTINDLDGLTFADVQDWNLGTFYFMEV